MKVTTDAILFGAWCGKRGVQHILDIGAGTGLLSLMMAQRHQKAQVIGVEVEEGAAAQAGENVKNSSFSKQVSIVQSDIQSFRPSHLFDLIVCNPPFFQDHLVSNAQARRVARHDIALSLSELVEIVEKLLDPTGRFQVMLPFKEAELLVELTNGKLRVEKICLVRASSGKAPHRKFLSLAKEDVTMGTMELSIRDLSQHYTREFYQLTIPFLEDRYFAGKMPD
ncbi:MAG: methyltransferase [Bacteroidota bacterium]